MTLTRIVAPALPPVDLAKLQAHLRVEPGDDDEYLQHCLDTAVAQFDGADGELGLALVNQTWRETFPVVPAKGGAVELTLSPVSSLSKVEYFDTAGAWVTVDAQTVELFEADGRFCVASDIWGPAGDTRNPLRIGYVAGFGDTPAEVPLPICHAILLFAAHLYEVREPVTMDGKPEEVPLSIARLVSRYKSWWR